MRKKPDVIDAEFTVVGEPKNRWSTPWFTAEPEPPPKPRHKPDMSLPIWRRYEITFDPVVFWICAATSTAAALNWYLANG